MAKFRRKISNTIQFLVVLALVGCGDLTESQVPDRALSMNSAASAGSNGAKAQQQSLDFSEFPGSLAEILEPPRHRVGDHFIYIVRAGASVHQERRELQRILSDGTHVFATSNSFEPSLQFDQYGNDTRMPAAYSVLPGGRSIDFDRVRATPSYVTLAYPIISGQTPNDAPFTFTSTRWPTSPGRSVFQSITPIRLCQVGGCTETLRVIVHTWIFGTYTIHRRWVAPDIGVIRAIDSGSVLIFPRTYIDEEVVLISSSRTSR